MAADKLVLDAARSKLTIRTRATGMLARLAHDLELAATRVEGRAEVHGDTWSGELTIGVDGLEVAGVLKHDRVDPGVLSVADRREIHKRMKDDAFRGAAEVVVRAHGTSRVRAELTIAIGGREAQVAVPISTRTNGHCLVVSGATPLSLKSLGSKEIKAPLGAFSVKDEIAVAFELFFAP